MSSHVPPPPPPAPPKLAVIQVAGTRTLEENLDHALDQIVSDKRFAKTLCERTIRMRLLQEIEEMI